MDKFKSVTAEVVYIVAISAIGYFYGRGQSEMGALMTAVAVFSSLYR